MLKRNDQTSTGLKALSAREVKHIILAFWRLNAAKAPIADFIPILDEDFEIVATDAAGNVVVKYSGLAGLEEHQYGKQIYYDQRFILKSFEAELAGFEATAHTTGEWRCLHCEPRRACSESLRADLRHTWVVRRSAATGRPLLSRHICTYFQYVEGYAPQPASGTDGYREFHLDFDRHWKPAPIASSTKKHV
jgi:hypothetical protein